MVENGTIKDLDSIEFDDQFRSVAARSLVLMSFPHAVKLLHRLGVHTVKDDVIVPEMEMGGASGDAQEVAVASVIMPEIEMPAASNAAQDVIMPEIEMAVASDAAQDVIMSHIEVTVASVNMPEIEMAATSDAVPNGFVPQIEVLVASNAAPDAVKNRIRLRRVPGSVFKTISGFENVKDTCLEGKEVRQVEPGQVGEEGEDIGGRWSLTNAVSACTGETERLASQWVKKHLNAIKKLAKSLVYIDSGHSSVSFIKLTKIYTNEK